MVPMNFRSAHCERFDVTEGKITFRRAFLLNRGRALLPFAPASFRHVAVRHGFRVFAQCLRCPYVRFLGDTALNLAAWHCKCAKRGRGKNGHFGQ